MKDTEYAFGVAKIRAVENRLLTSQTLESIISADSFEAAVKILSDAAPDKKELDFLIVKNDFHNVKAVYKSMLAGRDCEKYFIEPSVIGPQTLKQALVKKKYDELPKFLAEPAKKAYDLLTQTMDGQLFESVLDGASLKARLELARLNEDEFSVGLAQLMTALDDIKTAVRASGMSKERGFYEASLAECRSLELTSLTDAALAGQDALLEYISLAGYEKLAESIKISAVAFEREADNMLADYVKSAKYQSFGLAPIAAFCLGIENEIKTVRIVLSCKKNGFDEKSIRERVRKLYE